MLLMITTSLQKKTQKSSGWQRVKPHHLFFPSMKMPLNYYSECVCGVCVWWSNNAHWVSGNQTWAVKTKRPKGKRRPLHCKHSLYISEFLHVHSLCASRFRVLIPRASFLTLYLVGAQPNSRINQFLCHFHHAEIVELLSIILFFFICLILDPFGLKFKSLEMGVKLYRNVW